MGLEVALTTVGRLSQATFCTGLLFSDDHLGDKLAIA